MRVRVCMGPRVGVCELVETFGTHMSGFLGKLCVTIPYAFSDLACAHVRISQLLASVHSVHACHVVTCALAGTSYTRK